MCIIAKQIFGLRIASFCYGYDDNTFCNYLNLSTDKFCSRNYLFTTCVRLQWFELLYGKLPIKVRLLFCYGDYGDRLTIVRCRTGQISLQLLYRQFAIHYISSWIDSLRIKYKIN